MKNNNIFRHLTLAVALLATSSCLDRTIDAPAGDEGTLVISSVSAIEDLSEKQHSATRALTRVSDPRAENYRVKITRNADGNVVFDDAFSVLRTKLPMKLVTGDYILAIESHTAVDADWDNVHFAAEQTFTITKRTSTDLGSIVCKVSGILVSVQLGEQLQALMTAEGDRCDVTVRIGEGERIFNSTTAQKEDPRRGIFRAAKAANMLAWDFVGKIGGVEYTANSVINNVKAGEHRILTFNTIDPTVGQFTISINFKCETYDINNNVDVPDEQIVEPFVKPVKITSSTHSLTGRTTLKKSRVLGSDGAPTVAFTAGVEATAGLASLAVELTTDNTTLASWLTTRNLSGKIDLATATGAQATALGELGLPIGAAVTGQTSLSLNLATLLPVIFAPEAAIGSSDQFDVNISATDANNFTWSETVKLRLIDDSPTPSGLAIEGEGFEIDDEQVFSIAAITEATTLKVNIAAPNGIANFVVAIDSNSAAFNATLEADEMKLRPPFDLANPGTLATVLGNLGLPNGEDVTGDQVKEDGLPFDISRFVPIMATVGGAGFEGRFTLTITDCLGNTITKTLRVRYTE